MYNYIGRNCEKQFSQVVDIKTLVSDIKILCTVDQDVFHRQILLTRDTLYAPDELRAMFISHVKSLDTVSK